MEQACPALINSSGREADHGGEASGREEERKREGEGGRRNRGRRGWPLQGGGREERGEEGGGREEGGFMASTGRREEEGRGEEGGGRGEEGVGGLFKDEADLSAAAAIADTAD